MRPGPPTPHRPPRQRRGTAPQGRGRYPDFDVLDPAIVGEWDEATRRVVLARVQPPPAFRFFKPGELPTLRAFCDTMLAQHEEPRIPVPEMLDAKYAEGRLEGFQYDDVPDDRPLWEAVLAGLDFTARERYGKESFADLDRASREAICKGLQDGTLSGGPWDGFSIRRAYTVVLAAMASEFYAHPWAWNEIGFGGPAYPRGWTRFGDLSVREDFEHGEALAVDPVREVEERGLP